MITIYATRQLLRASKVQPKYFVSAIGNAQRLHSWYACGYKTKFPGNNFVVYISQDSALAIICHGNTIPETIATFKTRLRDLMIRYDFDEASISFEFFHMDEWVMSRAFDRRLNWNADLIRRMIRDNLASKQSFEEINLDLIENKFMDLFTRFGNRNYSDGLDE